MAIKKKKTKVIIAMSGGVDSSLAAWLLKKQGCEIIGIFMRLKGREGGEGESAARAVCRRLGLRFYPLNLTFKFKKEVIDYFLRAYGAGLTPNPCVKCNRVIKFKELLRLRKELGAEYLATGHYVRLRRQKNSFKLYRSEDKSKDQSYFLYNLTQKQLKHILFPLGGHLKARVREIAKRERLPFLEKESQDICFLNQGGKILEHNQYLKKYLKLKPGPIKTLDNKEIGRHQGLPLYTVGQRRGIEIGGTGPYYAAKADYTENTLYVVNRADDPVLFGQELIAGGLNWIAGPEPKLPFKCLAAIRYRHKPAVCEVKKSKNAGEYLVKFKQPQRAITPGQSIVFYKANELLGGGIIQL